MGSDPEQLVAILADVKNAFEAPPPLSEAAAKVRQMLLELPEERALTGPEIWEKLWAAHKINVDQSTLRKYIIPALKPYGVEHAPKLGYRIRPSFRPPRQESS